MTIKVGEDAGPGPLYGAALEQLRAEQKASQQQETRLGMLKLALAVAAVLLIVLLLHQPGRLAWALVPIGLFIPAAVLQEHALRAVRRRTRSIQFYENGLARVSGRFIAEGGEMFADPAHPYARDLDIFGKGSLFALLGTTRTAAGEAALAEWLLHPAVPGVVRERQDAVRELSGKVPLREALFCEGEPVRRSVHADALTLWGLERGPETRSGPQVGLLVLALLWLLSLAGWAFLGLGWILAVSTVLNMVVAYRLHARTERAIRALETASGELAVLSRVLSLFEQQSFAAPLLVQLQSILRAGGSSPAAAIESLHRTASALESRRNPLARGLDIVLFWSSHFVARSERWRQQFGAAIGTWLQALGELEALAALAGYAYEHPEDVFPTFREDGPLLAAEGLAHPLLPPGAARNDLTLSREHRVLILSGANMAGKSTFIRSLGINVVLAQCGAPVRARRMVLSPLSVGASISIGDSLGSGVSRFYAEIQRIKQIADLAGETPVLFLLDELFSGTNSRDRLRGTEFLLRDLYGKGAIGVVSTHDLALTQIAESLGESARNGHFADQLGDGELRFDYTLREGVVRTSNALALMRSIGLAVPDEPVR